MTAPPKLGIGHAVDDGEEYFADSLDALLGQTYEKFELIISDYDSTDGTVHICRRCDKPDSRTRCYRQLINTRLAPNPQFCASLGGA
jgi:glycosyltransferase involved in cell wall biosynthesis